MILQGWRWLIAAGVSVIVYAVTAPVQADPVSVNDPDLAKALAYFERGEYTRAVAELQHTLDTAKLQPTERKRALEALGLSQFLLGDLREANRTFTQLLRESPDYQPDPLYVLPEAVAFILDIKRSLASPVTATAMRPTVPTGTPTSQRADSSAWNALDLLPFGVGHFRKGYPGRATTLLTLEILFLGTNVSLYYYRHCELKARCSDPFYPAQNIEKARQLQTMQFVAGYMFVTTALMGIIDGLILPPNLQVAWQPAVAGMTVVFTFD